MKKKDNPIWAEKKIVKNEETGKLEVEMVPKELDKKMDIIPVKIKFENKSCWK